MSLEDTLRRIVDDNRSARGQAAQRMARLLDIAAMGTTDDLYQFSNDLIQELTALEVDSDGPTEEAEPT